jgi:HEAT repeat protein/diketogulonate reductase-like aldo/keto reductase
MRISPDHPLYLTNALRRPDIALAAVEHLHGATGRAEVEGLVELLLESPNARTAVAVIEALPPGAAPLVVDALLAVLDSPHTTVRLLALQALHKRKAFADLDALERRLREDGAWLVRRAAVRALADSPERWRILAAADDPHWRVRHALIQALLAWGDSPDSQRDIDARLAALLSHPRVHGVRAYLHYRWRDDLTLASESSDDAHPLEAHPLWDWDVAVLARNLERLMHPERRAQLDVMPQLLAHADERVRTLAADALLRWGQPPHLAAALALLDEPRLGAGETLANLLERLDLDRTEDIARHIVALPNPTPKQSAWALKQFDESSSAPEEPGPLEELGRHRAPRVRASAAELLTKRDDPAAAALLRELQADHHPHVRAAALTPERAAELIAEPTRETSWHVLAKAARLMKTPLWNIEPQTPWRPEERPRPVPDSLRLTHPAPPNARRLGPDRWLVSPMGVSGHYGLPVEGFAHAYQAGINLMFWEPNYQTMTDFFGRLPAVDRGAIHVIAGTFEADGDRVRRDAERVLRVLRIERIALFLMFWVQSWKRIPPDVRAALEQLQASGKVARYSLSTHNRTLAVEAMEAGWNPVMVRHSAAHRGAEQRIFPRAAELGTSLITFNSTCYARLLRPQDDAREPAAACAVGSLGCGPRASDFYRYTLSYPAVTVCLTAPSTMEQLEENLSAMYDPELPEERRQRLHAYGDAVYREDTIFRKLVRSR